MVFAETRTMLREDGMITKAAIRDEALRYLADQQSLSDFNVWLIEQTWDTRGNDPTGIRPLFGKIERMIAECDNGHLSIDDLRTELKALVSNITDQTLSPEHPTRE
jgi:hypothetical protein